MIKKKAEKLGKEFLEKKKKKENCKKKIKHMLPSWDIQIQLYLVHSF